MDADRIDVVTEWEGQTVSDGYAGLRRLADRGFSGAVTDGGAWLFMLNGRIVGVADGDLSAFEDASGTAYEAPHDSLPLLFAMQERGGEVRTKYYTNDTPVSEADRTLTAGNFTGYIELSENVLSGDYYVAYYGGESLSAAFVGNARQLKTGSEAFDLADDEVGIYTVYEVDLDVRDVPGSTGTGSSDPGSTAGIESSETGSSEPGTTGSTGTAGSTTGIGATGTDEADESSAPNDPSEPTDQDDRSEPVAVDDDSTESTVDAASGESADSEEDTDNDDAADRSSETSNSPDPETDTDRPDREGSEHTVTEDASEDAERRQSTDTDSPDTGSTDTDSVDADSTDTDSPDEPTTPNVPGGERAGDGSRTTKRSNGEANDEATDESVFSEEAEWREAKSIPSLDPSESRPHPASEGDSHSSGDGERQGRPPRSSTNSGPKSSTKSSSSANARSGSSPDRSDRSSAAEQAPSPREAPAEGDTREGAVTERERPSIERNRLNREITRLEGALSEATEERDELAAERDQLASERDDLEAETQRLEDRVSELEEELDRVRTELSNARSQLPDGERILSAEEAIAETNLFVRYDSKGGATLKKVHAGEADRDALVNNLRIEHHTSFEDDDAVVEGKPYREFLISTMEYGFTNWLVTELPFEIRETGAIGGLQDLYEVLPEIDRSEINGTVSVTYQENGEEHREQRTFDLVLRDRMGNPLIVANLNDSRDPTVESSLNDLVENGSRIAETSEEFTAGFAVTSSFFDPEALEAAGDATGGGLLSRSKKRSYVKISRKRGFHLCLAESRDGGFHLTVPEL
ncbi:hypothetical protein ACERIT_08610 [Halopenitus sp. H-Gu1]|uniref:DUF7527 domain-containing protein n=1 Tax=Halopenitus sp. H-Gu1 TaxID=3242697 RepID=UPI00359D0F37